jgi:hypothetical protein
MPRLDMSPSANYKTQGHIFNVQVLGALTDKRIRYYAKKGFYGESMVPQKKKHVVRKTLTTRTTSRQRDINDLMKEYL